MVFKGGTYKRAAAHVHRELPRDQIGRREVPLRDTRHLPALTLQPQHFRLFHELGVPWKRCSNHPEEKEFEPGYCLL